MKRLLYLAGIPIAAGLSAPAAAQAPGWLFECIDPANTAPYSTPYLTNGVQNQMISVTLGFGGTVTYGGQTGPCVGPTAQTIENSGSFAISAGSVGSIQTQFDDFMAFNFGAPSDPLQSHNFARISVGDNDPANSLLFGSAVRLAFVGASKRYTVVIDTQAGVVETQLEARVIGDAVRLRWRLINLGETSTSLGLWFAFSPYLATSSAGTQTGSTLAFTNFNSGGKQNNKGASLGQYNGYIYLPTRRPLRTEMKRSITDPDFPSYVNYYFGQTDNYGVRLSNSTPVEAPDQTSADFVMIANRSTLLSDAADISPTLFGDVANGNLKDNDINFFQGGTLGGVATVQRYPGVPVQPGQSRDVVQYIRGTWGVSNFTDPYTIVMDRPELVNFPGPGANNQDPNPMRVRVYVDNQFATIDKEVALNNVKFELTLGAGLSFAPGETPTKFLAQIAPNALGFVDYQIVADGKTAGDIPVSVAVSSLPGPTKTVSSTIRVAATPVLSLAAGPNMVSFPYQFGDNSLDRILNLTNAVDYVAYTWNSDTRSYQPTTSVQRGVGYWVLPNQAKTDLPLTGASRPTDIGSGGLLVNLKQGWNLIGNPYNYALPLQEIIGVSEENPADALTWQQLVNADFVTSALTYFVPDPAAPGGGNYVLTQNPNELLVPHRAYWVFVSTTQPLRLVFPPLFQPGLPQSGRAAEETFTQTDRNWRLQLAARSSIGIDTATYVGVVADKNRAKRMSAMKAPMAPGAKLEVSVIEEVNGQPTRMAQALSERATRKSWQVQVRADEAGEVTLTWPTLASVPRGVRLKLTDDATGAKKDLRATSGYTFRMDQPGTRMFTLSMEPGGSSRPVIGNVLVQPAGRDANSPVVINYALSADALVTVRVLSSTGKEVFTVTRGRADSAGENSVTWTLRDNANRAVAPGTYRVEILAETPSGERVRKLVPVNVIR